MASECKYSTSFFHSQIKKKPYIPHKGPKGFGGTTLINTVPKCLHTVRSSSDNAGKTPYFNCTGLRGRFHNSRTESFHQMDSSLGLLLMYYSLHRRIYLHLVLFYLKWTDVSRVKITLLGTKWTVSYCSHATIPRGVLACICQNPETYGANLCD